MRVSDRTKFQVVALLVREERARVKADTESTEAQRDGQLKRLDGIATILAKTAARNTSLLRAARRGRRRLRRGQGAQARDADRRRGRGRARGAEPRGADGAGTAAERRVVPQSVISRQLANPFLAPDFSNAAPRNVQPRAARHLGAARPAVPGLRGAERAAPRRAWTCPSRPRCGRPAASS